MGSVTSAGVSVPAATGVDVRQVPAADPRLAHATQNIWRYGLILAQLAALLFVFREFRLEERAFLRLAALMFFGFAVQYWLPFAWRRPFLLTPSLGSAYVLLEPLTATLLIGAGLSIYAYSHARLPSVSASASWWRSRSS